MDNTAKNFALQLGSLIALYVSLSAVVMIAFSVINIAFPDAAANAWELTSAHESLRFGIAMLIVFFPTYIVLTRLVNIARRNETGLYLKLTKWLIYLSLIVGGAILLGDLVAVIMTYLNGEVTTRFLLKAAVLLGIIGAAFWYYVLDAREYWNAHEDYSKMFGLGATTVVVLVLVFGFYSVETPSEVRERRFDEQQISDLQNIQFMIEDHYRVNGALPIELADAYKNVAVPVSPEDRTAYRYQLLSSSSFELCAEFAHASRETDSLARPVAYRGEGVMIEPYSWQHKAGAVCFERVVVQ